MSEVARLGDGEYAKLLEFRTAMRRFLHWSGDEARAAGLTPAQHQLLLAVKGHPGEGAPTVRDLAEHLVLKHHSAVELIDRAVGAGLVRRQRDAEDHRIVHLHLTHRGEQRIEKLSRVHLEELRRLVPLLESLRGE